MYISKLQQLISQPESPVYIGDFQGKKAVEQKLGLMLPDDYYKFIETYGAGFIGGNFIVYNPFIDCDALNLFYMIDENRYLFDLHQNSPNTKEHIRLSGASLNQDGEYVLSNGMMIGYPFTFYPVKNGLMPCGECNGEYTVFWKTTGSNWTIVVYDDDDHYSEYDMSLTEFLYRILTREISFGDLFYSMTEKGLVFEKYHQ